MAMKVNELINKLQHVAPDAFVIVRDLNGLHWYLEPSMVWLPEQGKENKSVIINTQGINRVP